MGVCRSCAYTGSEGSLHEEEWVKGKVRGREEKGEGR